MIKLYMILIITTYYNYIKMVIDMSKNRNIMSDYRIPLIFFFRLLDIYLIAWLGKILIIKLLYSIILLLYSHIQFSKTSV